MAMARAPRITGAFQGAMPSHHPDRLAVAHGEAAGDVGGDHLARNLRGHGRGLADHAGASMQLKPAHMAVAPVSAPIMGANSAPRGLEQIGGLVEERAARSRRRL